MWTKTIANKNKIELGIPHGHALSYRIHMYSLLTTAVIQCHSITIAECTDTNNDVSQLAFMLCTKS